MLCLIVIETIKVCIAGFTIKIQISGFDLIYNTAHYSIIKKFETKNLKENDFYIFVDRSLDVDNSIEVIDIENIQTPIFTTDDVVLMYSDCYSEVVINWLNRTMTILQKTKTETWVSDLRILTSLLVIQNGGLPLHCLAVIDNHGGGQVFMGPSGAGKSTVSDRLMSYVTILNEECNVLLPTNETFFVYATPFVGSSATSRVQNQNAPIKNLFILVKDTLTKSEEITLYEKYTAIMRCLVAFLPNDEWVQKVHENILNFCNHVPIVRFRFANTSKLYNELIGISGGIL